MCGVERAACLQPSNDVQLIVCTKYTVNYAHSCKEQSTLDSMQSPTSNPLAQHGLVDSKMTLLTTRPIRNFLYNACYGILSACLKDGKGSLLTLDTILDSTVMLKACAHMHTLAYHVQRCGMLPPSHKVLCIATTAVRSSINRSAVLSSCTNFWLPVPGTDCLACLLPIPPFYPKLFHVHHRAPMNSTAKLNNII